MRIPGTNISLGRGDQPRRRTDLAKQPSPRATGREQGSSGSPYPAYFAGEDKLGRVKEPSIKQIMKMIDQDGTAQGLYNVITFPALATDWHIEPHPDDEEITGQDEQGNDIVIHPQADFIEDCLRKKPHEGGMSTPFSLVLADILLGVAQGYRAFEIVYKLSDQQQVVLQKVVSRDPYSITILEDETGGFNGFKQNVKQQNGKVEEVTIQLPYCFLYTYRKERVWLKGKTAFRAGFYHYDKKHRLYYLANQQAQVSAIKHKVLTAPDNAEATDRDANLKEVDRMAVRSSVALPAGWELDIKDNGRGIDLMPYIDHHNVEMARSVLAQMTMLGTMSDAKGGSYALSANQTDLFMLGEKMLLSSVEEHITSFLISKLISFNFEKPLYPEFRFNDLTEGVESMLENAFNALISKGSLPEWLKEGIADKVAEQIDIEKPENADESSSDDNTDGGDAPADTTAQQSKKKEKHARAKLDSVNYWRELTRAEGKVRFAKIQKQAQTAEEKLLAELQPIFVTMRDDAVERLRPLVESQGVKALDGFELGYGDDLQAVMSDHMVNTYSESKRTAADEIKRDAPANKDSSKQLIDEHTTAIVEKQQNDILADIKFKVTEAARKNLLDKTELSIDDVMGSIGMLFDTFFDEKESLTVSSLITTAINIGRDDVYQEYDDEIYGYQYSAILDEVVCPTCEELDSSVATPGEYADTIWVPPIHFHCRCIWVAIMNDEVDPPDFTGIPDSPGGLDAPSLSKDWQAVIYLSKELEKLWLKKHP